MGVPFAELRDLRPTVFGQAADAWALFARAMTMLEQQVTLTVVRPMQTSRWAGQAAIAARGQASALDEGFALRRQLGRLAEAIFLDAQVRFTALQQELLDLIDAAAPAGLAVTDDGRVLVTTRRVGTSADYAELVASADFLTLRIADVLRRAAGADEDVADAFDQLQPNGDRGDTGDQDWLALRRAAESVAGRLGLIGCVPSTASPADAAAWWGSLSDGQRSLYISTYPDLIGALDGLPATDRDIANRIRLRSYLATHGFSSPELTELAARMQSVRSILARLEGSESSPPPMLLLGFDPNGQGRAIVAIGNPDTATDTCVFVPGATLDLDDMPTVIGQASLVEQAASEFTAFHPEQSVSVIAWLGYDPPALVDAPFSDSDEQGAPLLDRFVDGLHTSHTMTPEHTSVVGHSYGSALVGLAAQQGLAVDDVIVAGSLGLGVDNASELNLDPHHVWAGTASDDPAVLVASGAIGGSDPTDPGFGANQFDVDTSGHHDYWQLGSRSATNIGAIITGRYDHVTVVHGILP
ncbi:alpha/beta hydrolase [Hamadaea sp. NPDC051192]|uniref:alpha/beta hydrolase n=1 Tax=Hamadaea sp. NPDC051192 TaxID=3154940 RepID=UPI003415C692